MIRLESIKQFNELKKTHSLFLFSAKWCPDCRVIEPFLDELETMYSHMKFVYVDRDEFIDLCIENNVYGIPSFLVFNKDQLLGSFVSKFRKSKQEIIQFLEKVK